MIIQGSSKATQKAYADFLKASKAAVAALNRLERRMREDRVKEAKYYVSTRIYCGLKILKPGQNPFSRQ